MKPMTVFGKGLDRGHRRLPGWKSSSMRSKGLVEENLLDVPPFKEKDAGNSGNSDEDDGGRAGASGEENGCRAAATAWLPPGAASSAPAGAGATSVASGGEGGATAAGGTARHCGGEGVPPRGGATPASAIVVI